MKNVKVGVIGGGFGAKVHVPTFQSHEGFEVVALASVGRGRVEELKAETKIPSVYGNWQEMLEKEDIDLVSIVSAPLLHHEMVIKAYSHGIHVLCEKPFSSNTTEAIEMIKTRDAAKKFGFLNFEFRFLPARQKVKEVVASGKLGKLIHVNYQMTFPGYERSTTSKRGWLGRKEDAGGMLGAIGSHMFDSLLWWVNDDIVSVSGQLATHIPEVTAEDGAKEVRTADDTFQTMGLLSSGTTFSLGLTSVARHSRSWQLEIFGTEGTLVMTEDNKVLVGVGNKPLEEVELLPDLVVPNQMPELAGRYYNAFYRSIDTIYEAMTTGNIHPYTPTFEAGLNVQRILDAVRESNEKRRVVEL